jgi:hypothetical protein
LIVEYQVRPGPRVRVESFFETGESAAGASVKVHRSDGSLHTQGVIDEKGLFFFPFKETEDLRVVVNDGMGHRVEVRIRAKELSDGLLRDGGHRAVASLATPVSAAVVSQADEETAMPKEEPSSGDRGGVPIAKVLIGVAVLLVIAAVAALRTGKSS